MVFRIEPKGFVGGDAAEGNLQPQTSFGKLFSRPPLERYASGVDRRPNRRKTGVADFGTADRRPHSVLPG
jgi:hypothetical protein